MDNRNELAKSFKGYGVELGVAKGDFSSQILQNDDVTKLVSVDKWADHHDFTEYAIVAHNFASHGSRSLVLRATFEEALSLFMNQTFDFVYIDGYAHLGQEGGRTLKDWWPKLKSGGIFAGHDYHKRWSKTMQVVDNFVEKYDLELHITEHDQYPSWWVVKP